MPQLLNKVVLGLGNSGPGSLVVSSVCTYCDKQLSFVPWSVAYTLDRQNDVTNCRTRLREIALLYSATHLGSHSVNQLLLGKSIRNFPHESVSKCGYHDCLRRKSRLILRIRTLLSAVID